MISLQEYFKIYNDQYDNYDDYEDLRYLNKNVLQFETFLQSNFIIRNVNKIDIVDIPMGMTYEEHIEFVIEFLLQNNLLDNVLLFGLKNDYQNDVTKLRFSRTPSPYINAFHNVPWRMLYDIIGTNKFIDCLVNCSVFQLNGKKWTQVVGNLANKPNSPPTWFLNNSTSVKPIEAVYMRLLLYKSYSKFGIFTPSITKMTLKNLRDTIYQTSSIELTKAQKKKINLHLNVLLKNCTKQSNYLPMVNNICPSSPIDKATYHLDLQTPKKLVAKFVLLLLEKLIPFSMFGSKHNKSKIFSAVSVMINLPLNGVIYINDVMTKIKIKDLNFLYGGVVSKSNDQTRLLFKSFVTWLLSALVPRIIKSFFYCTEVSSTAHVVYFRYDVWSKITEPFIINYFNDYLVENVVCRNHGNFLLSKDNHNRMRIIPKKANGEFRLISVPFKGMVEEEHIAFNVDRMKIKIPVQAILKYIRHKRKTHFEKIDSPFQIASKLYTFKKTLLKQYGFLPELHFMKFDVASCYDSIPRNKVISVLRDLLKQETNFYVSTYTFHSPKDGRFRIKQLVNNDRNRSTDGLKIDANKQFFFNTETVLGAVKHELFKTALWVNDKCYLRKDGIFQGSGYSPLLVDILYDDMIETFPQFICQDGEHNLIVRIADDFLIISTSHKQIRDIKQLTLSDFGDYNAKVKKEKIVVTGSQTAATTEQVLHFCGIDIDIKRLEIWKSKQSLNVPLINASSSIATYHRLINLFKLRLEYHTLNGDLNSYDTIKEQIKILMENSSEVFVKAFKNKVVQEEAFFEFRDNIVSSLIAYTSNVDFKRTNYREMAQQLFKEEFKKKLKTSKLKYTNILKCLSK